MILKLPRLYYFLWLLHPTLQLAVAGLMYHRKLHRTFPVFFAYALSQVAFFAIIFSAFQWGDYLAYFNAYWILEGISLAIGFKVIHEIFLDVFRPYHALKDLGSVLFKWAALVMLLVACVVAAATPPGPEGPLVQAVTTVERCIRVIQCGLILFLLVFSKYVGVSWRQHSFGIALGFGGFASVELTMMALNASGQASQMLVGFVNMIGYNAAIVIWLAYVYSKVHARDQSAKLLMTQRWDQSLTDLHNPLPSDSLIPMFEGMVDQAFSRTTPETVRKYEKSDVVAAPRSEMAREGISNSLQHLPTKS
jgi:hypothetical protein